MRHTLNAAILLLTIAIVSCAPARGAAPGAPPADAPAGAGVSAEWQQVLAAARSEGAISIMAFPGVGVRDALVDGERFAFYYA